VGGRVVYLGPDLPIEELATAVSTTDAGAVALSLVAREDVQDVLADLRALRAALPRHVEIWVGGALSGRATGVPGVTVLDSFEAFEQCVRLYTLGSGRPGV
jgi:methylmalonyl-CoA mutase cobalamin-binding subunit